MAGIVHDLKTPLASIAHEAAVLDDWLARGDRSRAAHSVARIQDNVWFLDRITHDLLDVCAFNAGRLALVRTTVELRGVLERVIARIAGAARTRIHLEAPTTATVWIDEVRIQRVVGTLLDNALQSAPSNSTIVVQLHTTQTSVVVSVIDPGPAVASLCALEVHTRTRADAADYRCIRELGLSASKQIVEAHGGTFGLERLPGVGSRAFFELLL